MRTGALPLILVVPILAGCIGLTGPGPAATTETTDDIQDAADALVSAMTADHDHLDPTIHNTSEGLELVGYNKLVGEEGSPGSYTDIHKHGDHVVVESKLPAAGFAVVDVADPSQPEVVSYTRAGDMYAPDVKFGPNGDWIFTAAHGPGYSASDADRVTDHEAPFPYGISAWDASDKSDPKFRSYMQCGSSGVHNVNVAEIDGETWVFGACYDSFVNRVVIGRLDEATGQLVRVGEFSLGDFVEGNIGSVHDMVVNEDPVDGKPVLTVSYGNQGVVWVDVSDPMDPTVLGQWTWEGSEHVDDDHPHFLHYAELYEETVDGRRITVAAPEYHAHKHTGQVWIVNTTDYENPRLIGVWEGVANVSFQVEDGDPASVYRYSPHNIRMQDGVFYIAHNHAGVWAVDFASSEKRLKDPKPVGFYAGAKDPGHDLPIDNGPDFWGVTLGEDHVYASDRGTGLYAFEQIQPGHAGHDHDH